MVVCIKSEVQQAKFEYRMELPVKIQSLLKVDAEGFLCCSGKQTLTLLKPHQQKQAFKMLDAILDNLGALSAKAQALKQIITNSLKFNGTDHRIYIKVKDNKALGFIKVGEKNLFYRDFIGNIKELKPTCILDFYVHESCQRSGIGKEIFQKFLKTEGRSPDKLAYDRPSEKLIGFLKKHYGLVKYIPQNNNYVIFDRYFTKETLQKPQFSQTKPPIEIVQKRVQIEKSHEGIQSHHNIIENPLNSNSRNRPKSYIPVQKVQQSPVDPVKAEQKSETKRQFKQFQTTYQNTKMAKHKNATSEGNPLSIPLNENPTFRTTSNAYGNYYQRKL